MECRRVRYDLQCHLGAACKNYWDMQVLRARVMLNFSCLGQPSPFDRLSPDLWMHLECFVFGPSAETAFEEYALVDPQPYHPILPTDQGHWLFTSFSDHDWNTTNFEHENKWRLAILLYMLRQQGLEVVARNKSYRQWIHFWEHRLRSYEEDRRWRYMWRFGFAT